MADWGRGSHRRPPSHYDPIMRLISRDCGAVRFKSVEENQRLHFHEAGYTSTCCPANVRRSNLSGHADARENLLGNCFSPACMAILISDALLGGEDRRSTGHHTTGQSADQIVVDFIGKPHRVGVPIQPSGELDKQADSTAICTMASSSPKCSRRRSSGDHFRITGEVSVATDPIGMVPMGDSDINAMDIHVCEANARQPSVRYRANSLQLNQQHLHLMDSRVNLSHA